MMTFNSATMHLPDLLRGVTVHARASARLDIRLQRGHRPGLYLSLGQRGYQPNIRQGTIVE